MTNEPSWDDIFTSQAADRPAKAPDEYAPIDVPATTRRGRREQEKRGNGDGPRRKGRWAWLVVVLAFVVVIAGTGYYGWTNYEPQIRKVLGIELPNDYEGPGEGEEVVVVIQSGDIGSDVAHTLEDSGVVMTFEAFYKLLLATPVEF